MESEWVDQVFFCGGCNLLTLVGIAGNIFSVATLYPSKYSRTKGLFYRYLYLTTTSLPPHLLLKVPHRARRGGPAVPRHQPGLLVTGSRCSVLVLCSSPSVPQPVFTITEKAPAPTSTFTFNV